MLTWQNVGYKGHPEVMEAVLAYERAKVRWLETRLERALHEAKGDGGVLEAFNWYYGETFQARDGANSKSLGYMLPAVMKTSTPRAVSEICAVSLEVGAELPVKARALAIVTLESARSNLDEEGVETLAALKAGAASSTAK